MVDERKRSTNGDEYDESASGNRLLFQSESDNFHNVLPFLAFQFFRRKCPRCQNSLCPNVKQLEEAGARMHYVTGEPTLFHHRQYRDQIAGEKFEVVVVVAYLRCTAGNASHSDNDHT